MNEQQLIKALRKGSEEAVRELIRQYYPPLYRYVCMKLAKEQDADSIVWDVFARFVRQVPTYHANGHLAGYLYTIASSCCIDHLRREQRHRHLSLEEEIVGNESLQEDVIRQLEYEHLHRLIVQLPGEEQDVIYFYYLKQMRFREISELLGIPSSTLKTRHARALMRLRALWKEANDTDETKSMGS